MAARQISAVLALVAGLTITIALIWLSSYFWRMNDWHFRTWELKTTIAALGLLTGGALGVRGRGYLLPAAWSWLLALRFPEVGEPPPAIPVFPGHHDARFQEMMRHGIESSLVFTRDLNLAIAAVALLGLALSLYAESRRQAVNAPSAA